MQGKLLSWGFIILGLSCNQPKNTALNPTIATDSTALATQVDSSHAVSQDGLDFAPLNTGTYRQLPAALTQILNQKYTGWFLPEISKDYLKRLKRKAQGPYFVQGDFDGNEVTDYAVQFQHRDSITVAAYLSVKDKEPQEYILLKQPAELLANEAGSQLFVSQLEKGKKVAVANAPEEISVERSVIVLGEKESRRLFTYTNKSFKPVPLKSD